MLRSNSKSLGNHVVSPEEENERLRWEGFAEKEGSRPVEFFRKKCLFAVKMRDAFWTIPDILR